MLSIKFGLSVDLSGKGLVMSDWFENLAERAEAADKNREAASDAGKFRIAQIKENGPRIMAEIFEEIEKSGERFNARYTADQKRIALISRDPNGSAITLERTHYPAATVHLQHINSSMVTCTIRTRVDGIRPHSERTEKFSFEIDNKGEVYLKNANGGRCTAEKMAEICLTPFFSFF
jgi:hypothetical protein